MFWQIFPLCIVVIFVWKGTISQASEDRERSFSYESYMSLDHSEIEICSDQENFNETNKSEDSEELQDRYIHAALDEQFCLAPEQFILDNTLNLKRLYDMVLQPMLYSNDVMFYLEAKVFFIIYGEDIFDHIQAECSDGERFTYRQMVENIYSEIDGLFTHPNGAFKNGNPWEVGSPLGHFNMQISPSSSKHSYLYKLASEFAPCKKSNHT